MANETLSIRKDQARLTVIGKSKADTYIDSGLGLDLGDLPSLDLDPFDLNWQIDIDPIVPVSELPDSIKIITPPTKTSYSEGQKTDLDGIVVQAYVGGVPWQGWNGKYSEGYIPQKELRCVLVVTDEGTQHQPEMPDSEIAPFTRPLPTANNVYLSHSIVWQGRTYRYTETASGALFLAYIHPELSPVVPYYDSAFQHIAASKNPGTYICNGVSRDLSSPYTYNGKTVYYGGAGAGVQKDNVNLSTAVPNPVIFDDYPWGLYTQKVAWAMIYDSAGGNQLTINWARPQDGLILSAAIDITVQPGGGGR